MVFKSSVSNASSPKLSSPVITCFLVIAFLFSLIPINGEARWYDPHRGRFISRSPYRVDVEHPYAFTENEPLNFTDPTGMLRDCDKEHIECVRKMYKQKPRYPYARKNGSWIRRCQEMCLDRYMQCIEDNKQEQEQECPEGDSGVAESIIMGAGIIIIIGGVVYLTGGSGLLVLAAA